MGRTKAESKSKKLETSDDLEKKLNEAEKNQKVTQRKQMFQNQLILL